MTAFAHNDVPFLSPAAPQPTFIGPNAYWSLTAMNKYGKDMAASIITWIEGRRKLENRPSFAPYPPAPLLPRPTLVVNSEWYFDEASVLVYGRKVWQTHLDFRRQKLLEEDAMMYPESLG